VSATPVDRLRAALEDRYRIDREIGRGGMATVYLAGDLRHEREVAIKVLHPELTAILGGERFLQEIRVTARLAHPHILPLLDSGEAGGFLFYVAPYVEGESLRQRLIATGPLSLPETVRIARGVAAALDSAHRRGIIHRDIKPENILLQDGEPLVADFGIALAVSSLGRERLTETGLSLGTPAYLSPEQASADPRLDARSDQYSLACVVYEMLAGEPPYTGPTAQAIIAKRMTEPLPRLGAVREVPLAVESALLKGLSRNPADRFIGAMQFAQALEAAATTTAPTAAITAAASPRGPTRRVVALVSAVAALGIVGAMGWHLRPKEVSRAAVQRQLTFTGEAAYPAISPDGKWIAFASADSQLLVSEVSGGRAISVLSGSFLMAPRWSPDGASLLVRATLDSSFGSSDGLYEVPRLGGEPRRLGEAGTYAGDYAPDGKSVVSMTIDTVRISDRTTGNVIRRFTLPGMALFGRIRWSPDGRWIAASGWSAGRGALQVVSPEGRVAGAPLLDAGGAFAWDARGTSLYFAKGAGSGSDIVKVAIDGTSGRPLGPPVTLLSGLPSVDAIDVSGDGRALVMSRGGTSSHVWTAALSGAAASQRADTRQVTTGTRFNRSPALSPDGRWLVWIESDGSANSLLVAPFEGGAGKVIARYEAGGVEYPVWAPDSRNLGFFLTDSGGSRVMITDVDGKRPTPVATVAKGLGPSWTWGPGFVVVWSEADGGFAVVDLATHARRLLHAPDSALGMYGPALSPDGKTLIAAEWRAFGQWNRLHTIALDGGNWTRVPYDVPGDPAPIRWDAGGIFVDVTSSFGPRALPARVWRSPKPGAPFTPFLKPVRPCTPSYDAAMSLSSDHRRATCTESRGIPDVWLVTDFDPDVR
jgi:serine/threonine-protein kinase